MKNYEKLLVKKQVAEKKYLYGSKGLRKSRYEVLKNITKQLLKIEIKQLKRSAKNAYIPQKH